MLEQQGLKIVDLADLLPKVGEKERTLLKIEIATESQIDNPKSIAKAWEEKPRPTTLGYMAQQAT